MSGQEREEALRRARSARAEIAEDEVVATSGNALLMEAEVAIDDVAAEGVAERGLAARLARAVPDVFAAIEPAGGARGDFLVATPDGRVVGVDERTQLAGRATPAHDQRRDRRFDRPAGAGL